MKLSAGEEESEAMVTAKKTFSLGEEEERGSVWPQCIAALIVSLAYMSAGCALGWTSPTLPLLQKSHYIELTDTEQSWISGLVPLGAIFSPVPAGIVSAHLGHKLLIQLTAGLYLAGWAAVAAARSADVLYFARLLLGIANGVTFTICPTYIGEISQVKVRGALGTMAQLLSTAGFLYEYVVGPWSSYVVLALASGAISALLLAGSFFIPDSPYQLLRRGKTNEARTAFLWLRGKSKSASDDELQQIETEVAEMLKQKSSVKDLVANRATMRALLLAQGLVTFQQLSGVNAVLFFAQTILGMSVSSLQPSVSTIIVGGVMLAASMASPVLAERAGRRILLLVSAAGQCLSLVVLGVFFYYTNKGVDTSNIGFVPTLSLVIYIIVYSIGFGPLAWAVSAELFAPIVRSKAASLTAGTCWILCFVVTFFFQNLVSTFGSHTVFWTFSAFCGVGGVFVYMLLPETKGRTLREIQDLLGA